MTELKTTIAQLDAMADVSPQHWPKRHHAADLIHDARAAHELAEQNAELRAALAWVACAGMNIYTEQEVAQVLQCPLNFLNRRTWFREQANAPGFENGFRKRDQGPMIEAWRNGERK